MLNKILVALDHSSEASTVFDFALSLSPSGTREILLVHFVDWQMQDVSPWIGLGTLYDINISDSRYDWSHRHLQNEVEIRKDWLKFLTEKAQQHGIDCSYECQIGNCNLGIADRAKDWGADLIVIGRRGHRNISEIFLGSVSNYVIHHAPCSVLVVQGSQTGAQQESADEYVDVVNN